METQQDAGVYYFSVSQPRRRKALALGQVGEPAFILAALARDLSDNEQRRMQQQLRCSDGSTPYLFAVSSGKSLHFWWPLARPDRGDQNWFYNVDTQSFNPNWEDRFNTVFSAAAKTEHTHET